MYIYLVAYDLYKPGQDYKHLYAQLEEWNGKHILESTWIIKRKESATKIKNILKTLALDGNDKIVVIQITPDAKCSSSGLTPEIEYIILPLLL